MNSRVPVAIALGSNLGDREAHLDFALSRLSVFLEHLRSSPRYDTAPVEVPGNQPTYLNAVAVGEASTGPEALLESLQQIESERGRERPYLNGPRTLDLDLILYGNAVLTTSRLTLPHPRFRERAFVLEPLAAIAPAMRDPVTGLTVRDLLERLRQGQRAHRP